MSYAEGSSYWPPKRSPEHSVDRGLQGSMRESLDCIDTRATQIGPKEELEAIHEVDQAREEAQKGIAREPEEGLVYTDYDMLGRYCLSDGTVVFSNRYETGQLEIGDSRILVLAYGPEFYEGHGAECAVVLYELDAYKNIANRSMVTFSGFTVEGNWALTQYRSRKHGFRLASYRRGYLTREMRSRRVEDVMEAVTYAVNNPCSDDAPKKLDHLSRLDPIELRNARKDQRLKVDIIDSI